MTVQSIDAFSGVDKRVDKAQPVDVHQLMSTAREALDFNDDSWGPDRYLKRKEVVRSLKAVHALIDIDGGVGNPLQFYPVADHLELISLLAQLHIAYANLMTSFQSDGSVFVQYNDVAHATPEDYGIPDEHYSELSHVSQCELNDRELAQQLGDRLVDLGYESGTLSSALTINLGALAERYSNYAWYSPEGDARKLFTTETASAKVERYLPTSLRKKIGLSATMMTGAGEAVG